MLPQNVIPEVLLRYYLSVSGSVLIDLCGLTEIINFCAQMPMTKSQAEFHNAELASHCAYSLPGVALTLGRQNWRCLKDIYLVSCLKDFTVITRI